MGSRETQSIDSHPASASFSEKGSFKNTDPAIPVKSGARKVKTVASDSDRYCREKYMPKRPKNLSKVYMSKGSPMMLNG